jgi:S1-C subfamily serine protease
VELVPGRIDGRLLGLQVQSIRESGEFLTEAGISPGDIILSVNGEEVLFPEQFMQIWEAVPGADTLTVRLLRDGNTQTLEWTIFDDSEVAVNAD